MNLQIQMLFVLFDCLIDILRGWNFLVRVAKYLLHERHNLMKQPKKRRICYFVLSRDYYLNA